MATNRLWHTALEAATAAQRDVIDKQNQLTLVKCEAELNIALDAIKKIGVNALELREENDKLIQQVEKLRNTLSQFVSLDEEPIRESNTLTLAFTPTFAIQPGQRVAIHAEYTISESKLLLRGERYEIYEAEPTLIMVLVEGDET